MRVRESTIEQELIEKLGELKYTLRPDIRDRAALEANFRQHFQALNKVTLTDAEFARLLDEIVTPDVFAAAHTLRHRNAFTRDDGTPLNYTLVNIGDWCKNTFEVASQLRWRSRRWRSSRSRRCRPTCARRWLPTRRPRRPGMTSHRSPAATGSSG